jgi:superfamily II DNA or RNA helicase/diadenosine tetraphosphate (Ap4A) HIT family hydrolase
MPDCPFCTLEDARPLLADPLAFAIRDANPVSDGHTLVVLRRHVADYFEATGPEQAAIWQMVAQVKAGLDAELDPRPDGYNVGFNAGGAAGQTLMHAHVHVIPRYVGDVANPRGGVRSVIPGEANSARPHADATDRARVVTGGSADPLLHQLLPALDGATRVDLALAFVFEAGVEILHDRLVDILRRHGARVRILTGDYQDVTEPMALRHLLNLRAIADAAKYGSELELKVYQVASSGGRSFHPKAWIVRGPDMQVAWVGSSNLSKTALVTGVEWNYQLVEAAAVDGVHRAFDRLWNDRASVEVDTAWIDAYERRRYAPTRLDRPIETAANEDLPVAPMQPRPGVQREALLKLDQARLIGERAGMVVLATGLGKTYLSAFDSRSFKRVLFVAHREEILTQALETFRKVRPNARLGLYHGTEKEPDADLLFASVQTLSSREHLEAFDPRRFDYVVIDEFHHAAAETYRRIIEYFDPKFMLGLTATPDRTDGGNLLSLCDGNEIYRAGIARGITDKQLAPFRYYGIGDVAEFDTALPWRDYTDEMLTRVVTTDARAAHVLATLAKHTSGPIRALGFCVSKAQADFMTAYFRAHGRACAAVYSGSSAPRTATLQALGNGEIEIVFCVDMFNEGVDVPTIDTVLMLRPTGSSIVWLQQLGRGLRHVEGKTLTVLDFIGNHEVFLRRPEMLFSALELKLPRDAKRGVQALLDAELPDGVEIEFDLSAKDILAVLERHAAASGSKPERWYREFRVLYGARPTALEADRAGHLKALAKREGGWLAYVRAQGDLNDDAVETFDKLRPFFEALESLEHAKSYELLVLLALLNHGSFPRRVEKDAIVEWVAARAQRSTAVMRDLGNAGADPRALRKLLEEEAFSRLAELAGGAYLTNLAGHVDASALAVGHPDVVRRLATELVDHLLTPYLENANKNAARLPPMRDGDADVDARFDVEAHLDSTSIVFHSRGEAAGAARPRNTQYREGLTLLLRRLSEAQLDIEWIELDSADAEIKRLSVAERTAVIPGHPFPWRMRDKQDHEVLSRAIGNATKKIGQKPGVKGGNDTRRIRIVLREAVPEGELWHRLSGR